MKQKLIFTYKKAMFKPNLIGFLINQFFIIRRGIYNGIYQYRNYLTGKILDFGCGEKPYKDIIPVSDYVGLDIKVSGHNNLNNQIDVFYDEKEIPFKKNTFDSIFVSEVFEHVFNLDEILTELYRVLKPNGYMLVTVPFDWDEHEQPHDFGRYSSYRIQYLLEQKKFKIVRILKTTTYIQTLFQMASAHIFQYIFPKNKV